MCIRDSYTRENRKKVQMTKNRPLMKKILFFIQFWWNWARLQYSSVLQSHQLSLLDHTYASILVQIAHAVDHLNMQEATVTSKNYFSKLNFYSLALQWMTLKWVKILGVTATGNFMYQVLEQHSIWTTEHRVLFKSAQCTVKKKQCFVQKSTVWGKV